MTTEWDQWGRPSPWRRWALRLLALLALAGVIVGLYAIYQAAIVDDAPKQTPVSSQLQALSTAAEGMATQLEKLRPKSKPKAALRATAKALDASRAAAAAYKATDLQDTNDGERVSNAIDAERELINAINATLKDPNARLRATLPTRASRARRALSALPDDHGLPQTVRGIDRLRAWARAND